jgi:hypothetical protein
MKNITIAGNSLVVTSDLTLAEIQTAEKYRPNALKLVDEKTDDTLFRVGAELGADDIDDFGVIFGGVSNDESKRATITLPLPAVVEDKKAYVEEIYGVALAKLGKVEAQAATALEGIKAERDGVANKIEIKA